MLQQDLENLVSGFEALSRMLERFITAHETDPPSGDVLFAILRAKDAADHALTLIDRKARL